MSRSRKRILNQRYSHMTKTATAHDHFGSNSTTTSSFVGPTDALEPTTPTLHASATSSPFRVDEKRDSVISMAWECPKDKQTYCEHSQQMPLSLNPSRWWPCRAYTWFRDFIIAVIRAARGPFWVDVLLTLCLLAVTMVVMCIAVDIVLGIVKVVAAQDLVVDTNCTAVYVTVPEVIGPIVTISLIGNSPTDPARGTFYFSVVNGTTQWLNSIAPTTQATTFTMKTTQITSTSIITAPTTTTGGLHMSSSLDKARSSTADFNAPTISAHSDSTSLNAWISRATTPPSSLFSFATSIIQSSFTKTIVGGYTTNMIVTSTTVIELRPTFSASGRTTRSTTLVSSDLLTLSQSDSFTASLPFSTGNEFSPPSSLITTANTLSRTLSSFKTMTSGTRTLYTAVAFPPSSSPLTSSISNLSSASNAVPSSLSSLTVQLSTTGSIALRSNASGSSATPSKSLLTSSSRSSVIDSSSMIPKSTSNPSSTSSSFPNILSTVNSSLSLSLAPASTFITKSTLLATSNTVPSSILVSTATGSVSSSVSASPSVPSFMTIQTDTMAKWSESTTLPFTIPSQPITDENTAVFQAQDITKVISYGDTAVRFVFPTPSITTTVSYWTGIYPTVTGPLPWDLQELLPSTRTIRQTPLSAVPSFELFSSQTRRFKTVITTIYEDSEIRRAKREPAPQAIETVPSTEIQGTLPPQDRRTAEELPGPASCGESGNFTLNFDDTTVYTKDNTVLNVDGLKNPYHHLFWANGYTDIPDKWEPYPAISQPNVAMFLPLSGRLFPNQPFAGSLLPGEIGAGPRASVNAYWFHAYSGFFGCALNGITPCLLRISGFRFDQTLKEEVLVAEQNVTIPACWGYIGCRLTQVMFSDQFRALSGIQVNAYTAGLGIPQVHMMDDLQMEWYNNSCSAGILRIGHR